MSGKTLVLGIGNVLLGDEAAGVVALHLLESECGPDTSVGSPMELIDGGTLGLTLALPICECERLIVIDAAALGGPPGTVRVFEDEAMDRQLGRHANGVHQVGIADLMAIARLTDTLPRRRALIGIEPAVVDWRGGLTPQVEAALPRVLSRVRELMRRWDLDDGTFV